MTSVIELQLFLVKVKLNFSGVKFVRLAKFIIVEMETLSLRKAQFRFAGIVLDVLNRRDEFLSGVRVRNLGVRVCNGGFDGMRNRREIHVDVGHGGIELGGDVQLVIRDIGGHRSCFRPGGRLSFLAGFVSSSKRHPARDTSLPMRQSRLRTRQ